jgi:hypothetical protein
VGWRGSSSSGRSRWRNVVCGLPHPSTDVFNPQGNPLDLYFISLLQTLDLVKPSPAPPQRIVVNHVLRTEAHAGGGAGAAGGGAEGAADAGHVAMRIIDARLHVSVGI